MEELENEKINDSNQTKKDNNLNNLDIIIKNIYIDAGGIYGYTICGVLQVLQNYQVLEHIENVLSCSVGSILGLFICLGFTVEEMTYLAFHIDISKFVNFDKNNFLNIYKNYGFEKGTMFEKVIKTIIKSKTGNPNFTFQDLYQKYKKNLIIVGGNVSLRRHQLFSYQETPDMELWKAIRISCSFPLVFQPFQYKNCYYVDGGNSHYNPSYFKKKEETIGIILEKSKKPQTEIKSFEDFIMNMIYLPLKSQKFKNYDPINCIEINTQKIVKYSLDVKVDYQTKKDLYFLGYDEMNLEIKKLLSNLQNLKIKNLNNKTTKQSREIATQTYF